MDDHSLAAISRIQLFMADLSHVLSIAMPADTLQSFPNPSSAQNFPKRCTHVNRPTRRPRAWKKNGPRNCCCQQPKQASHAKLPVLTTNQHPSPSLKEDLTPAAQFQSAAPVGVQPDKSPTDRNSIQVRMSAHDLSSQDTSEYDLESTDDGSVDGDSHLPINEIRRRITNPLTPRLKIPASNADVQEPASNTSLYNERNISRWASTVSKEELERLRGMGLAALVESFRQYATAHLDQASQPTTAACLNPIPDGNVNQGSTPTRTPEDFQIDSRHHTPDGNVPHNESNSTSECDEDFRGNPVHPSDTDVFQPEAIERQIPASCTDVQTPVLDMSMFDDRNIRQWADTLSKGERKRLLEADCAARNQSFRLYAATHLRQPTSQPIAPLNPMSDEIVDHEGSIATRTPEDSPIRCGHHAPDENLSHDDSCSASECDEDLEPDFPARNQSFWQGFANQMGAPCAR
ncbi:hypothetical protein PCANC_02019 [Puccinia coronata f. sp. avenae]|uniref:Uncharacterized protein n=1 Tax=Puccinia coronata f. sp. avenae TaxID=200324 RepID=A0A2N5T2M0_9BASI|nr:hypothetical protein PCANC_07676 [Puccinia coronata f. sp. avenae]PLW56229.1 hypothetical protein PCANC_02019 [Puccinia coronata f. sp. avenae]